MGMLVSMSSDGRLTVPASTRRELGIEREAQFEVEVSGSDIRLKPLVVLPREDAWAYTSEHRRLLERAHEDSHEGRVSKLTESKLAKLVDQG